MSQAIVPTSEQQPVSPQELKEKAQEKGQEVKGQAGQRVREQVDERSRQAAEQVRTLAQTLRRNASELRTQGQQSQAAAIDQLAIRAEQLAGYLSDADPDKLLDDAKSLGSKVKELAKKQPLVIAAFGLLAGAAGSRLIGAAQNSQ